MKRDVVVRARFVADVKAQVSWLRANDHQDWIPELKQGLAEARTLLARVPAAGMRVEVRGGAALRKLVLRKLPFVVWYVVDADAVHLLRLFHVRQDRHRRPRTSSRK